MSNDINTTDYGILKSDVNHAQEAISELKDDVKELKDDTKEQNVTLTLIKDEVSKMNKDFQIVKANRIHDKIMNYALLSIIFADVITHGGLADLLHTIGLIGK